MNSIHTFELDLIRKLQFLHCETLDHFFLFMNFFDSGLGYLLIIAAVWLLLGRKIGSEVFYIGVICAFTNATLKSYFGLPRPCQIDPTVALVTSSSGGFPSGATQAAIAMFGLIGYRLKNRFAWIFIGCFVALTCITRVYLGLHFFTDVLGGLFFGALTLIIFLAVADPLEEKIASLPVRAKWAVAILAPLLLYLFGYTSFTTQYVILAIVLNMYLLLRQLQKS